MPTEHQTIILPANCPPEENRRQVCVECIHKRLAQRAGIHNVAVQCRDGHAHIELDFDPAAVSLAELQREVSHAGLCLGPEMVHMVVPIEGMYSPAAEQVIEAVLNRMPGVTARASYVSRAVRLDFDRHSCPLVQIISRASDMGFKLRFDLAKRYQTTDEAALAEAKSISTARSGRSAFGGKALGWLTAMPDIPLTAIGIALLISGWSVGLAGGPPWLRVTLLILSYCTAGFFTAIDTVKTLASIRFDIDVLMFAAAFGAAALGHYEEGALLLVLFSLGHIGEHLAMDRAHRAIEALTEMTPQTGTVRDADGSQREVPVEQLEVGQQIVVHPFGRVAADGKIVAGNSPVDQSPITGESMPVDKKPGDEVFAGTINGDGQLLVAVTRPAAQTTLAKIIRLVTEAQATRSPTQTFTDAVSKWYVPLVLIGAAAVALIPTLFFGGVWATWFYRSMAVLTAASPCALAIGTPAAVLCGIARAARLGVLIKGGAHLENLGRVRAIAFDKTGTLTRGRAEVTEILSLSEGYDGDAILRFAAAVEQEVRHPLAVAIVAEAQARNIEIPRAEGIEEVTGAGLVGIVEKHHVAVGRPSLLKEAAIPGDLDQRIERLNREGRTAVVVSVDSHIVGLIAMADRPRDNAAAAITRLRKIGIRRTIMLTGDNKPTADAVGLAVGIDEVHAQLLPDGKVEAIRDVARRFGSVAMIGDGVNDAPALAAADIGIAMGGAGTDVALETADVALMGDDLDKLCDAVGLSRASRRIIVQNLVIALGVIAILAPTAALGGVSLGVAVVFHEGSTVLVVLNALRLLGYRAR